MRIWPFSMTARPNVWGSDPLDKFLDLQGSWLTGQNWSKLSTGRVVTGSVALEPYHACYTIHLSRRRYRQHCNKPRRGRGFPLRFSSARAVLARITTESYRRARRRWLTARLWGTERDAITQGVCFHTKPISAWATTNFDKVKNGSCRQRTRLPTVWKSDVAHLI